MDSEAIRRRLKFGSTAPLEQQVEELQSRLAASEERARKAEELAAKVALYVGLHVEDPGDFDSIIEYAAMYDETEASHALPAVRRHLDQSESDTETPDQSKKGTGHGSV